MRIRTLARTTTRRCAALPPPLGAIPSFTRPRSRPLPRASPQPLLCMNPGSRLPYVNTWPLPPCMNPQEQRVVAHVLGIRCRYDTVIFLAHHDHVNYPCDKVGGYPYMNVEIVAVKLVGTYACGAAAGHDPGLLRSGWGNAPCNCNDAFKQSNCGKLIRALSPEAAARFDTSHTGSHAIATSPPADTPTMVDAPTVPDVPTVTVRPLWSQGAGIRPRFGALSGDCTRETSADPPWFASCKNSSCLRISIESHTLPLPTLNIGNTTRGQDVASGFDWCIDHLNRVVYAKMNAFHQVLQMLSSCVASALTSTDH